MSFAALQAFILSIEHLQWLWSDFEAFACSSGHLDEEVDD